MLFERNLFLYKSYFSYFKVKVRKISHPIFSEMYCQSTMWLSFCITLKNDGHITGTLEKSQGRITSAFISRLASMVLSFR